MVIDGRFVRRMVVVGEEIDEIQVFVQSGYIVTFVDVLDAGRHRQREQKSRSSSLRRLPLELLPQFLRETNRCESERASERARERERGGGYRAEPSPFIA